MLTQINLFTYHQMHFVYSVLTVVATAQWKSRIFFGKHIVNTAMNSRAYLIFKLSVTGDQFTLIKAFNVRPLLEHCLPLYIAQWQCCVPVIQYKIKLFICLKTSSVDKKSGGYHISMFTLVRFRIISIMYDDLNFTFLCAINCL